MGYFGVILEIMEKNMETTIVDSRAYWVILG